MAEHVIAMDPGGRSGWASATMGPDRFELTGGGVLDQDEAPRWLGEQQSVGLRDEDSIGDWGQVYDVFVYESWYPRPDESGSMEWIKGDRLVTPQRIGALLYIARESHMKIITQHPSDKPQALKNMPQAILDLDKYSNEQHDKDARMHLWLYFWRNWFTASKHPNDIVVV